MAFSDSDFYLAVIDAACARGLIPKEEGTLLEDDAAAIVELLEELSEARKTAAAVTAARTVGRVAKLLEAMRSIANDGYDAETCEEIARKALANNETADADDLGDWLDPTRTEAAQGSNETPPTDMGNVGITERKRMPEVCR